MRATPPKVPAHAFIHSELVEMNYVRCYRKPVLLGT